MDTKSINKLNDQINVLKRQFTEELNTVNYYYWPLTSKSKKKLGNLKWYFTLACCLFFSVIILLLLHEVTNPYWIGIGLGVSGVILILTLFFLLKARKKDKALNKEWEKSLEPSKKLQKELNENIDKAIEMMLTFFGSEKDYIVKNIGTSYEDILDYYYSKTENN